MEMRSEWEAEGLIQVMSLADAGVRGDGRGLFAPETSNKKNGLIIKPTNGCLSCAETHKNPVSGGSNLVKINKSKTVAPCGDEER